ncbi:hypothetical protein BJ875DRAFT_464429 [Amylocarpus encephaloides]|uniref:Uncharacterized protein n=1 Tax=Amylocarpus encephaloides TaxID=45428 RepID=A0A9P7YHU3_9HELO|nr:hypothetical protein BJ875DRAFT_464429 [Amylocarpus encephaloides]
MSKSPATMLQLQASFNYNSTQSRLDSSTRLSPSLFLAVYDPTLGLDASLSQGFSRLSLIPANGIVSIAISLRLHNLHGLSAYDYDLNISSSPAMELTCDLGGDSNGGYTHDCRVSLFMQFTGFERVIVGSRKKMSWADVAASAGAYFSFVQFISWIVSLQAFSGE